MAAERLKVNISTFQLNNGLKLPAIGYVTWLGFDNKAELVDKGRPKVVQAMSYAIDVGYRHIDTSHFYSTEEEVGDIVRKKIKEGVMKREDMFITTKGDGVDEKNDYLEIWSVFEFVLKQGLVKSIGVSNFNIHQMERLLRNCQVKPVVIQVELDINLDQKDLASYCQKKDVLCVAYTPFGSMIPGRYDSYTQSTKVNNPKLISVAKKHGKTVGQVALRYVYERGLAAIPKTLTRSQVIENASILDLKLDASDFEILEKFDKNYHPVPSVFPNHDNYPLEKVDNFPILDKPVPLSKWVNRVKNELRVSDIANCY